MMKKDWKDKGWLGSNAMLFKQNPNKGWNIYVAIRPHGRAFPSN
jgi:hypothetical protein